jgi:2-amino-4-hydroxy-6-hydroxymethyldihydropteridine diphosphokinase
MNEHRPLILIGIGANLNTPAFGSPRSTCEAAVGELDKAGVAITRRSSWFKSAPVPISDQPWYINGVVGIDTDLEPAELISLLHNIEDQFGRVRSAKNAARTLDLDIIAYGDLIVGWNEENNNDLVIPHPRLNERAFVLLPMLEIVPKWCHPVLKLTLNEMISGIDPAQQTLPDDGAG